MNIINNNYSANKVKNELEMIGGVGTLCRKLIFAFSVKLFISLMDFYFATLQPTKVRSLVSRRLKVLNYFYF